MVADRRARRVSSRAALAGLALGLALGATWAGSGPAGAGWGEPPRTLCTLPSPVSAECTTFGRDITSAQAQDLTSTEAAALARDAITSDGALADLRAVDTVDGAPVDLQAVTAQLGEDRAARLELLATSFERDASAGSAAADPGAAQGEAERILEGDKYQENELPRPFRGVLEWLADGLRPVTDAIGSALEDVPGGPWLVVALVAVGVVALTWWLATRRRAGVEVVAPRWPLVDPSADPEALDRAADAAERDGDHATAVRLRYEAGLVRLARAERIVLRPDTTARAVADELDDATLRRLTDTFEAVTYGGRPATATDAREASDGWRAVSAIGVGR